MHAVDKGSIPFLGHTKHILKMVFTASLLGAQHLKR